MSENESGVWAGDVGGEKEAKESGLVKALAFFSQRGTAIFNCAEAYILSQGYTQDDVDALWSKVQPPSRRDFDPAYGFETLMQDLQTNGHEEAARFVREYVDKGYPGKRREVFFADKGLTVEAPWKRCGDQVRSSEEKVPVVPSVKEAKSEKESSLHTMNLLMNFEATLAALVAMEGEEWLKIQREQAGASGRLGENDVDGVLAGVEKGEGGVIYGRGGWARYPVDERGNVHYLVNDETSDGQIAKAKELGFAVISYRRRD